jgi:Enoyl-(Acyl carrier protein) reductase
VYCSALRTRPPQPRPPPASPLTSLPPPPGPSRTTPTPQPPGQLITAAQDRFFPGLAGVVKTLADEHGPSGIRVNGLLPVRIATDRVRQLDALLGDPDEVRARLSQNIPLRRYGEPAEFGQAAAFVLSPAASYVTGVMIPIDGGAIRSF